MFQPLEVCKSIMVWLIDIYFQARVTSTFKNVVCKTFEYKSRWYDVVTRSDNFTLACFSQLTLEIWSVDRLLKLLDRSEIGHFTNQPISLFRNFKNAAGKTHCRVGNRGLVSSPRRLCCHQWPHGVATMAINVYTPLNRFTWIRCTDLRTTYTSSIVNVHLDACLNTWKNTHCV